MASSSRNCTFPVSLKSLLLVSSLLAMTAASPVANAQYIRLTVLNHVSQPLNVELEVSNTSSVPGSTGSITVIPGGTGFLILNASHPWQAMLFHVDRDTYKLVSDKNLDRMFRYARAGGLNMTVSGPPCVSGQRGLQTETASLLKVSVAKCAEKKK